MKEPNNDRLEEYTKLTDDLLLEEFLTTGDAGAIRACIRLLLKTSIDIIGQDRATSLIFLGY